MTIRMWAVIGDAFNSPGPLDASRNIGTYWQLPQSTSILPGSWAIWNTGGSSVIVMCVEVQVG